MFSVKEKICTFASGSAFILTERKQNYRDVAQLVAYYVRDVGVASSSLVIPTFKGIEKDMKQVHRLVSCLFFVCQVISVQDIKDYQSITYFTLLFLSPLLYPYKAHAQPRMVSALHARCCFVHSRGFMPVNLWKLR